MGYGGLQDPSLPDGSKPRVTNTWGQKKVIRVRGVGVANNGNMSRCETWVEDANRHETLAGTRPRRGGRRGDHEPRDQKRDWMGAASHTLSIGADLAISGWIEAVGMVSPTILGGMVI